MTTKKQSYKEAIEEIEETLASIENDELDVDELADKVKRVTKLLTFCKDKLQNTQEEVEKILRDMDE